MPECLASGVDGDFRVDDSNITTSRALEILSGIDLPNTCLVKEVAVGNIQTTGKFVRYSD